MNFATTFGATTPTSCPTPTRPTFAWRCSRTPGREKTCPHCRLDYFGRGLSIVHEREQTYRIHSDDRDLAHEIAFLTILSRVGRHLDAKRLFRVHALGVEAGGRGVLLLLPMGGGKTTLAMRLLQDGSVKLLSEDSPLLGPDGTVLPFPLRIGVRVGGEPEGIPAHFCRTVERMEFCPKTLIDIEYFRDRLASPCPIGAVLLGERRLAGPSSIRPLPRRSAIKPFIKNTVVGLGLYQGVEFVLERSGWEVLSKMGLAMRRLGASLSAIRRADVYRFAMGPDVDSSADVLGEFLQRLGDGPAESVHGCVEVEHPIPQSPDQPADEEGGVGEVADGGRGDSFEQSAVLHVRPDVRNRTQRGHRQARPAACRASDRPRHGRERSREVQHKKPRDEQDDGEREAVRVEAEIPLALDRPGEPDVDLDGAMVVLGEHVGMVPPVPVPLADDAWRTRRDGTARTRTTGGRRGGAWWGWCGARRPGDA